MRISITDRDNEILNFVEENKSITIEQCRKIFCNYQKRGDVIARRRLSKLVSFDKLKVGKDKITNQNVYYMDRKLSYHDLLLLDYYAELSYCGSKIVYFKREKSWLNGKIKSDAFCCHIVNNKIFFDVVEANVSHSPSIEHYKELYESGELHNFCNGIYKRLTNNSKNPNIPRFILIDDVKYKKQRFISENVPVIQLNLNLDGIAKIYLPIAK